MNRTQLENAFTSYRLTHEEYTNLFTPESLRKLRRREKDSYKAKRWCIPWWCLQQQPAPDFQSIWQMFYPTRDGYEYFKDTAFGYKFRYDCKEDSWERVREIPKLWCEL
jgi:hypothetical protein